MDSVPSDVTTALETDETKNLNLVKTQSESKINGVTQIVLPNKGNGLLTLTGQKQELG